MTTVDELADLRGLARDIFSSAQDTGVPDVSVPFDDTLWKTLAESGLTLLTAPEDAGGSGAGLFEWAAVLRVSAEYAAAVPLAETDVLAAWLLNTAGLPIPSGPLTVASGPATGSAGSYGRVPWARSAETVVVLADTGDDVVVGVGVPTDISHGYNVAYEPRDTVRIEIADPVVVNRSLLAEFRLRGGLARAVQISGAVERALDSSIEHANSRVQFGRALGKFQAVQHLVAEAAGEVAIARTATDVAVRTADEYGFDSTATELAIATARSCAGHAADVVARNAHQVHGAIGFTLDHTLRRSTMRALSWRDEFGTHRDWNRTVGRYARDSAQSRMGVWHMMTGEPSAGIG